MGPISRAAEFCSIVRNLIIHLLSSKQRAMQRCTIHQRHQYALKHIGGQQTQVGLTRPLLRSRLGQSFQPRGVFAEKPREMLPRDIWVAIILGTAGLRLIQRGATRVVQTIRIGAVVQQRADNRLVLALTLAFRTSVLDNSRRAMQCGASP